MRVFLAHSKGTTDIVIQRWAEGVKAWFKARGEEVEVVAGVDDFNQNIGNDGTFDAWARGIARRVDTFTGLRVYGAVVVPGREMGKATGLIVQGAFEMRLYVFSLEDVGDQIELYDASGVTEVDPNDFFRGWVLSVFDA